MITGVILGLSLFVYQLGVRISDVEYTLGASSPQQSSLPLFFESTDPAQTLVVRFSVNLNTAFHSSYYTLRADDCLESLMINGTILPREAVEPCIIDQPATFFLRPYLSVGDNTIVAEIRDSGGRQGISFAPARSDPLLLSAKLCLLFFLVLLGLLLASRPRDSWQRATLLILVTGALLRLMLLDATPFNVRTNDVEGHIDYILYVVQYWAIPKIHQGWEFYQPPLYYFLMAIPYRIGEILRFEHETILRLLQGIAWMISVGLLWLCSSIARHLFSDAQKKEQLFWVAIIALFPGMVLFAPRINNDVLLQTLSFLSLGLAVSFWQKISARTWYILIMTLALALLTKMNAVPLVVAAFLTLALHPACSWKRKFSLGIIGLCILFAMTEWLFVLRFLEDSSARMVGNIGNLHGGLMVTRTWSDFIVFNPIEVLWHPYNHAWDDAMRRSFFFEYFYRSAFFGEFFWGTTLRRFAQILLFGGLLSLIFMLAGFLRLRAAEWRRAFPLWIFFIVVLASHLVFRFYYPFASSQDFRYSTILLLPAAYFLLIGIAKLPHTYQRYVYAFLVLWLFACGSFMVALTIVNPQ